MNKVSPPNKTNHSVPAISSFIGTEYKTVKSSPQKQPMHTKPDNKILQSKLFNNSVVSFILDNKYNVLSIAAGLWLAVSVLFGIIPPGLPVMFGFIGGTIVALLAILIHFPQCKQHLRKFFFSAFVTWVFLAVTVLQSTGVTSLFVLVSSLFAIGFGFTYLKVNNE